MEKNETGNNFYQSNQNKIVNKTYFDQNNNMSPILGSNLNPIGSNNPSNPISPKINQDSRDEIKDFLLKVKEKIPGKDFKDFIGYIKMLTDKNNVCNKKEIINHMNTIFQNQRDLYARFEEILLIKKN